MATGKAVFDYKWLNASRNKFTSKFWAKLSASCLTDISNYSTSQISERHEVYWGKISPMDSPDLAPGSSMVSMSESVSAARWSSCSVSSAIEKTRLGLVSWSFEDVWFLFNLIRDYRTLNCLFFEIVWESFNQKVQYMIVELKQLCSEVLKCKKCIRDNVVTGSKSKQSNKKLICTKIGVKGLPREVGS